MKCRIAILPPLCLLFAGAALGVLSKMLDIYTTNLGNVFSELSIWILLGTLIAFFSRTKAQACVNILPFCLGCLLDTSRCV